MKGLSKNKSSDASLPEKFNSENFWEISPQEISSVSIKLYHFNTAIEDKLVHLLVFTGPDAKLLWRAKSGSFITDKILSKLVKKHNLEDYNLNVDDFLRLDKIQNLLGAQKYAALMNDIQWNAKKSLLKSLAKRRNSELATLIMNTIRGDFYIENDVIIFSNDIV